MTDEDLEEIKSMLEDIKQKQKEFDERIDYLESEMKNKERDINDIYRTQKQFRQKIHFINQLLD